MTMTDRPSAAAVGELWFNQSDNMLYVWDGQMWLMAGDAPSSNANATFSGPLLLGNVPVAASKPVEIVAVPNTEEARTSHLDLSEMQEIEAPAEDIPVLDLDAEP